MCNDSFHNVTMQGYKNVDRGRTVIGEANSFHTKTKFI